MGQKYLTDSNVIIEYTSNLLSGNTNQFLEHVFNNVFNISVIVMIEVLGFNDAPQKLKLLEEFLSGASLLPFDNEVTNFAIQLRKAHKKLKLGDAIIAATALAYRLELITRNVADFKNILDLQVVNPFNISNSV